MASSRPCTSFCIHNVVFFLFFFHKENPPNCISFKPHKTH